MLLFLVCLFFFVTLRPRRAVRSSVTYFEQVLCRCLWVDFDNYIIYNNSRKDVLEKLLTA